MAVFLLFCALAVIQTHGFQAPIFFTKKNQAQHIDICDFLPINSCRIQTVVFFGNLYDSIVPKFLRMCQPYFVPNLNHRLDSAIVVTKGDGILRQCHQIVETFPSPPIKERGS